MKMFYMSLKLGLEKKKKWTAQIYPDEQCVLWPEIIM